MTKKTTPEVIVHQEHECFSLISIDGELFFFDIQLQKVARVSLPAANTPSLVEYPKPVSVSPRSGISTIVDRKDK